MAQYKFFAKDTIPAGIYKDVDEASRRSRSARSGSTSAKQPDDLVYEITKALWSDKTRAALDAGHAKGKVIRKETATTGRRHPAASRRREVLQGSRAAEVTRAASPSSFRGSARVRPPAGPRMNSAEIRPMTIGPSRWNARARSRAMEPSCPRWNSTRRRPASSRRNSTPRCASGRSLPPRRGSSARCSFGAVAASTTTRPASGCCPRRSIAASTSPSCSGLIFLVFPIAKRGYERPPPPSLLRPLGIGLVDWLCAVAAVVAVPLRAADVFHDLAVPRRQSRRRSTGSWAR